jgi:outer membrane protein assembly factor BamD
LDIMARYFLIAIVGAGLLSSCSFHRKKYDDPITKDTKQPDKVLFDRAIDDIEHGRFEVARITLNTLINTYDQSEFLAKAKLAVADSWFREGGTAGLAQAEAEYKDFILFYPTMEEAAESQQKICMIHYKQMDKVDRDQSQAIRAEDECRQLIVQFPNSKYVDETKQMLRNIQEAIAEGEFDVALFYTKRGDNSAATGRYTHLVEQYPLYSKADVALWQEGQAYGRLGTRFRKQEGEAYSKIVRDYPLSDYADDAAKKLKELELPVPEADKTAVARMQYEKDHKEKPGIITRSTGFLTRGPDMSTAAHQGDPAMTTLRATVPPLVPQPAAAAGTFNGEVSAQPIGNSDALDTKPDARTNPPGQPAAQGDAAAATPASPAAAASTDASKPATDQPAADPNAKKKKKTKKVQPQPAAQPATADPATAAPAAAQPAAAQPGAGPSAVTAPAAAPSN